MYSAGAQCIKSKATHVYTRSINLFSVFSTEFKIVEIHLTVFPKYESNHLLTAAISVNVFASLTFEPANLMTTYNGSSLSSTSNEPRDSFH